MSEKSDIDLKIIEFARQNIGVVLNDSTRLTSAERHDLWCNLGTELNVHYSDLKTRWIHIKTAYRHNLQSRRTVPYKYQPLLGFLDYERIYGNGEAAAIHQENGGARHSEVDTTSPNHDGLCKVDPKSEAEEDNRDSFEDQKRPAKKRKKLIRKYKRPIKEEVTEPEEEELVEEQDQLQWNNDELPEDLALPEDPLKLFFDAMCASTRRLSADNIHRARKEIFDLIHRLEADEIQALKGSFE